MSEININSMILSPCATNCYYIYKENSNKVIFVDPGDRGEYIYDFLNAKGLEVDTILLTHGHFDHIWGCEKLRELSGAKVYALAEEEELLLSSDMNVSAMAGRSCTLKADGFFKDGDVLDICGFSINVLATPGHTAGSCCFYFEAEKVLISGDTLFEESVGRTDFPTGSGSVLAKSIREKLAVLSDDVKVYPGHGDATTIGHERDYNPFWG